LLLDIGRRSNTSSIWNALSMCTRQQCNGEVVGNVKVAVRDMPWAYVSGAKGRASSQLKQFWNVPLAYVSGAKGRAYSQLQWH
jgi:hypothetical protein